ncbi:MAG: GNAT family N-acetyltransferase [Beijerinckiaceae bacterium]|nr:GNAT family N-acetyltransferase [Beijerinckiaceae bacterium]
MIHLVTPENEFHYRDEMDQAFRLRHKIFVEQMGWTGLAKEDGREIDQFDTKHAVHMLHIERGKVLGYQRLLPTSRPHLLSNVMPELCEGERPEGAHIWEISRHCVVPGERFGGRFACAIALSMGIAMVEWGLECGISKFIIEIEPAGLLPLVQLHFQPLPLGLPKKIGGRDIIALLLSYDERTLERMREMQGSRRRILAHPLLERPVLLHA